jgi:hypothetical protein
MTWEEYLIPFLLLPWAEDIIFLLSHVSLFC